MLGGMKICGQEFSEEIIERIRETVRGKAGITRTGLSRKVCEWLSWRHKDGRLKEMNCRAALLKLSKRGVIELPEAKPANFKPRQDSKKIVWPTLKMSLAELGEVEIVKVGGKDKDLSRLWWQMMDAHHPLDGSQLCGAQLRYLVRSKAGWLGGLSFSAAAWRLKARDEWIGWDEARRIQGLSKIVSNSRFLILPTIEVPNLASHILGLAMRRLPVDWRKSYGEEPVLVETFVDSSQYQGTCYRAANWINLGLTQGRGRQDRKHEAKLVPKQILVYPLRDDWRMILCDGQEPLRAPVVRPRVVDWAEEEFGNCALGDMRLTERLTVMARDFYAQPTANLPQACGSRAKTKAAYRFLDHEATSLDTLLKPHYEATERRLERERVVLAAQDTSSLNYSSLEETEGLGPIGTTADGAQGLIAHSTLCFNLEGTPLGLIDVQSWRRDPEELGKKSKRRKLNIEEKESIKWLKSYRALCDVQARNPKTLFVSMGDREADIYELFYEATIVQAKGPELLIRAAQNRRVDSEHAYLWETVESRPVSGVQVLKVPRTPKRAPREAQLEIRFAEVVLKAPKSKKTPEGAKAPDIRIFAVLAKEVNTNVKEPLEWLLLTTMPVVSFEDAVEKLVWYTKRWGIEVFHKTIKSGCRIEERQLCTAERLETCLAIDLVVAWRIYYITKLAREAPGASAELCFEEAEWKAVMVYTTKGKLLPSEPPTLRDMVHRVAGLGGFLGRKCDGEPGTQTLWRGLHRMSDITAGYNLAISHLTQPLGVPQTPVSSRLDYG